MIARDAKNAARREKHALKVWAANPKTQRLQQQSTRRPSASSRSPLSQVVPLAVVVSPRKSRRFDRFANGSSQLL